MFNINRLYNMFEKSIKQSYMDIPSNILLFIIVAFLDYRNNQGANTLLLGGIIVGYCLLMKIISYLYIPSFITLAAYYPFYIFILGEIAVFNKITWSKVILGFFFYMLLFHYLEKHRHK